MKLKNNAGSLVALTLFLAFVFLVLWEFWLEKLILVDYLDIEVHKNSLDRWTFVVSCLSIVSLSLIPPLKNMIDLTLKSKWIIISRQIPRKITIRSPIIVFFHKHYKSIRTPILMGISLLILQTIFGLKLHKWPFLAY